MTKRVLSLLLALLLCIASLYTLLCNIYSIDSKWGNIAPWFGMPEEVQDLTEIDLTSDFTIMVTEQQRNQWLNMLQEQGAELKLNDGGFELTSPIGLVNGRTIDRLSLRKDQIHEGDNRYCFRVETGSNRDYNNLSEYRQIVDGGDYSVVTDDGKSLRIEKKDGKSLSLETNNSKSFSVVTSEGKSFCVEAGVGENLIAKTVEGKSFNIESGDEEKLLEAINAYNDYLKPITTMLPVKHPEFIKHSWWKIVKLVAILLLPLLISTLLLFLIAPNCGTWHGLQFLVVGLVMGLSVNTMMNVMVLFGFFGPFSIDSGLLMMFGYIFYCILISVIWIVLGCFFLLLRAATRRLRRKSQIED